MTIQNPSSLTRHAVGLFAGLVVQYLLGMVINMYVTFPESQNASQLWEYGSHNPWVITHIIVAVFIFLGSFALLVRAYRLKSAVWLLPAWVGFLAIFLAGFGGSRFIPTQQDPYSYLMAVSFLLAFAAYSWGTYRAK